MPHRAEPAATGRAARDGRPIVDRAMLAGASRAIGVGLALTLIYAFAPLGRRPDSRDVLVLVLCVLALAVVIAVELRLVARSPRPELRAVEAVAITLPLTLFPFAAVYYSMARSTPGSFGTALSRLDAMYFTVTTFATVGYGDIVPKSQAARAVVLSQVVLDLVLIGLIAKVITGIARQRRAALLAERGADDNRSSS